MMTHWRVSHGDLLEAKADGLLCSANPSLNLSGGVGGALLLRYGTAMQELLKSHLSNSGKRFVDPGTAVVTPGCGSNYQAVAHAVAIDAFYDTSPTIIRAAYNSAIEQLSTASCRTIAAACLACGYGRCSVASFLESLEPLIAFPFPNVDVITLMTTNADLAEAITSFLNQQHPRST